MRLPCTPAFEADRLAKGIEVATCQKFEAVTQAEIDTEDAEFEALTERFRKAAPALSEIRKAHKGKSGHGEIPCPTECGGTLHWGISGYNGHMRGRCTTAGCLNWIE